MLLLQAAFPRAVVSLLWVWTAQLPPDVTCAYRVGWGGWGLVWRKWLTSRVSSPLPKGSLLVNQEFTETKPGRVEPAELPAVICPLLRQEQYLHFWVACCVAGTEWLC